MNIEKKQKVYKIIMAVLITAFITFLVTLYGVTYYYTKTDNGKIQVIEQYLEISDISKKVEARIELVKTYIDNYYLGDIDEEKLIESAVKGYVNGLGDVYTEYLTQDEYEELMVGINGEYVGIGIYMTQDNNGNIVIVTPMEGSAAEESGLEPGDYITKVDGEECKDKDLTLVSNKIKGEEGTTVELEIWRDGETFTKTIERRTVTFNYVKSEVLENNIGYIQILSFEGKSSSDVRAHYEELKTKGITSLIIDIRGNGGGLVSQALEIADMIVPKDKVLMRTFDKEGNEEASNSKNDNIIDMEVILLVDEHSASASEILAGALKDNEVATLVGTKTFGKGIMQEIKQLKSGGAMKITIQEFKTPNGDKIHKTGIEPDYVVEKSEDKDQDLPLEKAIELLKSR